MKKTEIRLNRQKQTIGLLLWLTIIFSINYLAFFSDKSISGYTPNNIIVMVVNVGSLPIFWLILRPLLNSKPIITFDDFGMIIKVKDDLVFYNWKEIRELTLGKDKNDYLKVVTLKGFHIIGISNLDKSPIEIRILVNEVYRNNLIAENQET